jgi:chitodextrinase
VDLGGGYQVTRVRLRWAAACAKAYRVELSRDAVGWETVSTRAGFGGGTDDSAVDHPGAARYVRVFATQRCRRGGGYALNEFEVYGKRADTTPPTAPANLRLVQVTPISVTLTWNPSTDDVGVTGYALFRDGSLVKQTPGDTVTAVVGGLTPDTAYTLWVVAQDAAGNWSPPSATLPVRTMPGEPSPPTPPRNLRVVDVTSTCVTLAWDPSADDIGMVGYLVYMGNQVAGNTPVPTLTICDLTPATTYTFSVAAVDAQGNVSQRSNSVAATTRPA